MKLTQLLLACCGIFSFNLIVTSPLLAQCVQTDVGVQADFSRGKADQTYAREAEIQGSCVGNTNVTTGAQINVSGNGVVQRREVKQRITGGSDERKGANGPNFQHGVNVQFDLDNQADGYNPNMPSNSSSRSRSK